MFVVRNREDLILKVIPFFERQPLLSSKQQDFLKFASIVQAMAQGKHLSSEGFQSLRDQALSMNGGGRYRRVYGVKKSVWSEGVQNPQRPYAERVGRREDMVRSAWRHAESRRNVVTHDRSGRR